MFELADDEEKEVEEARTGRSCYIANLNIRHVRNARSIYTPPYSANLFVCSTFRLCSFPSVNEFNRGIASIREGFLYHFIFVFPHLENETISSE